MINNPASRKQIRKRRRLLKRQSRNKVGNKGVRKVSQYAQINYKRDLNISPKYIKESHVTLDFSQKENNANKSARRGNLCIPAGHRHKKLELSSEQIIDLPNRSPHKKVKLATVEQKSRLAELRSKLTDRLTGTRHYSLRTHQATK